MRFLSETNLSMHKEYLRELNLRLSIFEKSYTESLGKSPMEILRLKIPKKDRIELFELKSEIAAHNIFFSSFLFEMRVSDSALRYDMLCEAMRAKSGFLVAWRGKKGEFLYMAGEDYREIFKETEPMLAVDLCEHSYFYDYGFDKKK